MTWKWGYEIDELMPSLTLLSDFYLDTEFEDEHVERMARCCIDAGLSSAHDVELLERDIAPACAFNLFSVAGEWDGFDPDWLKQRILEGPSFLARCEARLLAGYTRKHAARLKRVWPN